MKGVDLLGQFSATGAKGKRGESLLVPTTGDEAPAAKAVLLVGVGPKDAASPDACRRAIGRVARQLARRRTVATTLPQIVGARDQVDAVQATVEGVLLGSYRFDRYKSKDGRRGSTPRQGHGPRRRQGRREGDQGGEGGDPPRRGDRRVTDVGRDLVNTPALDLPPAELAREAQAMAKEVGLTSRSGPRPS